MAQEILKQALPASLSPEAFNSLADILLAKLEGKILSSMLTKRAAAGSSPVSRSTGLRSNSSQKFTKNNRGKCIFCKSGA